MTKTSTHIRKSGNVALAVAAAIYILYNFTVTSFIVTERLDSSIGLGRVFTAEVIAFIPVLVFFLIVRELYRKKRWLFTSLSWKAVTVHVLLLAGLISTHSIWQVFFNAQIFGFDFMLEEVLRDVIGFLNLRALIYIISIGLVVGIVKIQEKEHKLLKQSELQLQLQKASFKELELKLNPEVIYPNLDFIKRKARSKPAVASELLLQLSKQLRILLDHIEEERLQIKSDLLFFEHYIRAVELRREAPLVIHKEVKEDCMDLKIPSLVLLVPFLEEFFFGGYAEATAGIKDVTYRQISVGDGYIQLALEFSPVLTAGVLAEKVERDPGLVNVQQMFEDYEGSSVRVDGDGEMLSIYLKVEVPDYELVED